MSYHDLTRLKRFVSQRTSKLCNYFFYLTTFSTQCMCYLLYLMFRCDRRCDGCDGKFGNSLETKHTLRRFSLVGRARPDKPRSRSVRPAGTSRRVASRRGHQATRRLWLIAALLCVRTQGGAAAFGWGWEGWIRIPAGLGVLFHVPLERNLSAGQRKASAPKTLQLQCSSVALLLFFFFLLLVNEKLPVREISFGKQEIH